jgi:hypothetical protein
MEARFEQAIQKLGKTKVTYKWEDLKEEVELAYSGSASQKEYKGGYWANQGVYQKLFKFLHEAYVMPSTGRSKNENINLFLDMCGIWRDLYNNGWMNNFGFDSPHKKKEPEVISKLRDCIDLYEELSKSQAEYYDQLTEAQLALNDVREQLSELCRKRHKSSSEEEDEEEEEVSGTPFTFLDVEYAMNAAIRLCIGAADLDDAKLYPKIDLGDYGADEEGSDE